MAWLAGKLDEALGMRTAHANTKQQTSKVEATTKHYPADKCVTLDYFKQAMTSALSAFAEVTQSHLLAIEARVAAIEEAKSSPMRVDSNCLYPGGATTCSAAASKGMQANPCTKTQARRIRRARQKRKHIYSKEQLLQLRPLVPVSRTALKPSCDMPTDEVGDLVFLEQRVANLEVTMAHVGATSGSTHINQCSAEGVLGHNPWMHAVPGSILAMECKAVRVIQRAWRRTRHCMKLSGSTPNETTVPGDRVFRRTSRADMRGDASASTENRIESFADWSPWLFFDLAELRAISQTCSSFYDKVSDYTPFLEYGRSLEDREVLV